MQLQAKESMLQELWKRLREVEDDKMHQKVRILRPPKAPLFVTPNDVSPDVSRCYARHMDFKCLTASSKHCRNTRGSNFYLRRNTRKSC
jgi:hypothetical protein